MGTCFLTLDFSHMNSIHIRVAVLWLCEVLTTCSVQVHFMELRCGVWVVS